MGHVDTTDWGPTWAIVPLTHPGNCSSTMDRSQGGAALLCNMPSQNLRLNTTTILFFVRILWVRNSGRALLRIHLRHVVLTLVPWWHAAGERACPATWWDSWKADSHCGPEHPHGALTARRSQNSLLTWWHRSPRECSKRSWWQLQGFL